MGGRRGGGNPGVKGGTLREAGEERVGSGIPKVAGTRRKGTELGVQGTESGKFRPPCPPPPPSDDSHPYDNSMKTTVIS